MPQCQHGLILEEGGAATTKSPVESPCVDIKARWKVNPALHSNWHMHRCPVETHDPPAGMNQQYKRTEDNVVEQARLLWGLKDLAFEAYI